jgi:hypothetical protein
MVPSAAWIRERFDSFPLYNIFLKTTIMELDLFDILSEKEEGGDK